MTDIKQNRTQADIKREKVNKLKNEISKATRMIRIYEAREKRALKKIERVAENHMKNHVGGTANMIGLLRYVYNDVSLHDNPQDALMENRLTSAFLRAARMLEGASLEELIDMYQEGDWFRHMNPTDRGLPEVNSNLQELFDFLKNRKTTTSSIDNGVDSATGDD